MKVFAANMVRTHFAAHAARIVLALVVITGLGCRSRSERDLVERELRMHEDQVYALEDYLSEYQAIVQRYRCENQELKLQLAQARAGESRSQQGSDTSGRSGAQDDSWSPDRPRSRSLLDRQRAADQPDPFKDDGPAGVTPTTPEIEIDVNEPEIELGPPAPMTPTTPPAAVPDRGTSAPPHTEPAPPAIVPTQILSNAQPLMPTHEAETEVFGEIVQLANLEEPSLHVEVRPRSIEGTSLDFTGVLEVMLLDPAAGPAAPALARWEFTAEEVEQAWRDPDSREAFDVLAGVPEELPLDRPLELWIRLLPTEGGKILASTVLRSSEDAIVATDDVEPRSEKIDGNVTTAGHWVPSKPDGVPKQANTEGGWSPRK